MENLNAQPTFKKYSPAIVDVSKRSLEISAADVAVALGAESQSEAVSANGRLPMRYAFRSELYQRNKIPVSSQDWAILERIAARLSKPGVRPSAALVGGQALAAGSRVLRVRPEGPFPLRSPDL